MIWTALNVLLCLIVVTGNSLRGDNQYNLCGVRGQYCRKASQKFRALIPNSYKLLLDLGTDDYSIEIERHGDLYTCFPECFEKNVGNKCDMCLVDTENNIWCDNQEVGRGCVNRCCEYEGDAGSGSGGGSTKKTKNGETIPSSYEKMVDLGSDNDDYIEIDRHGDLYTCYPTCFEKNVGNKCDMCLVDTENNIWCDNQEVGRGCVNRCCEFQESL